MPFSSGTYSLPSGNPVVTGTTISSTTTNTTNSDIATALSSCILKDGTQTVTADIPMASHKITGLAAPTTAGDALSYGSALGTPASGVVTNLTGTASININGTVGATTATTGAFTNLAYTGTLTGSTGILNIGSGQVYKDASGNVGIGTVPYDSNVGLTVYRSQNSLFYQDVQNPNTGSSAGAIFRLISSNAAGSGTVSADFVKYKTGGLVINNNETNSAAFMSFGVGASERMRIDSSGNLLVGTTAQLSPGGVLGVGNIINTVNNGSWALALQNNGSTAGYGRGLGIRNTTDFNTGSSEFIYCVGGGNPRFYVQSNGGIYNYSANNSNLSDERVKKDIEPAPSWLNKINAIEVVNFKYKDQTHDDFNLGVIAQQVEAVAPELINIDGFGETPEDGIPLKSIYETDLVYAMLKSIQELKAIIDTQQEQINSLLGK